MAGGGGGNAWRCAANYGRLLKGMQGADSTSSEQSRISLAFGCSVISLYECGGHFFQRPAYQWPASQRHQDLARLFSVLNLKYGAELRAVQARFNRVLSVLGLAGGC